MLVSKNDKYGVIDIKGNTIVKTEYDKIYQMDIIQKKTNIKNQAL